jgi:hypothetical protein
LARIEQQHEGLTLAALTITPQTLLSCYAHPAPKTRTRSPAEIS